MPHNDPRSLAEFEPQHVSGRGGLYDLLRVLRLPRRCSLRRLQHFKHAVELFLHKRQLCLSASLGKGYSGVLLL